MHLSPQKWYIYLDTALGRHARFASTQNQRSWFSPPFFTFPCNGRRWYHLIHRRCCSIWFSACRCVGKLYCCEHIGVIWECWLATRIAISINFAILTSTHHGFSFFFIRFSLPSFWSHLLFSVGICGASSTCIRFWCYGFHFGCRLTVIRCHTAIILSFACCVGPNPLSICPFWHDLVSAFAPTSAATTRLLPLIGISVAYHFLNYFPV